MQCQDCLFYIALAFILVHEMDAVRCREWKMLPGLSMLEDELAYRIFVLAHIPLIAALLYFPIILQSTAWRIGLDVFLLVHVVLHLLMINHRYNLFRDWISWVLIAGAGFFGLADLTTIYL